MAVTENSTPKVLVPSFVAMEGDIHDIERWGQVLAHLSVSPNLIGPEALHPIACAVTAMGRRLATAYQAAWDEQMARG